LLEPEFKIRDFGTGLSEDGIINLYTTYGSSSKRSSNLFKGAMGVGSKAPFSYVDNFNIISYFNGEETLYSCYIEEGAPNISKFSSMPTKEPNGLLISLAVKREDVSKFSVKASQIYHWFSYKPKTNVELTEIEVKEVVSGEGWMLHELEHNSYSSNSVLGKSAKVIMGNICYPVDTSVFSYGTIERDMGNLPFILEANIGDVKMAASREALSMTPETIKWLTNKFKKIRKELRNTLQKEVDSQPTIWKKYVKIGDIHNSIRTFYTFQNMSLVVDDKGTECKLNTSIHYLKLPENYAKDNGIITFAFK